MEALQVPPSSESKRFVGTSISCETLGDRLASISKIPSSIIVPSSSLKAKAAHSTSTKTASTTTTEQTPDTSTTATSVVSLPLTFTVQKLYVSPSTPMDEKLQAIWLHQIRPRLSGVLHHEIPVGNCVQEFMMAGRRPDTLKPSLVITCGDAATKKKVTKIFKRQGWLQNMLKTNRIMFLALAAETLLSAGQGSSVASMTKLSERYAVQLLPPGATTSCGLGILKSPANGHLQHHCTFGGLIMVNGTMMGLTAGHPFSKAERNDVPREPSDAAQITEDSSDDDSGSTSDEPFVFNDADDGGANDQSTDSSVSLHETDEHPSSPVAGPSRAR